MGTGSLPFRGESTGVIFSAILDGAPVPPVRINPEIPPKLEEVINKALEKDRNLRYQNASDIRTDVQRLKRDTDSARISVVQLPMLQRRRSPWLIRAAVCTVAVIALVFMIGTRWKSSGPALQTTLSQVTFAEGVEEYPAWSPDGRSLLYTGEAGKTRKIFRKDLASGQDLQLTHGDFDELQPTWSPDGKQVAFVHALQPDVKLQPGDGFGHFQEEDVWDLDLASSKECRLVENAFKPTYSPDGKLIALDAPWAGPRPLWLPHRHRH